MGQDLQDEADRRFEEALNSRGARDPREFYRGLLRDLKEQDRDTYTDTVRRWKEEVIGPLARGEQDPLDAWHRFGLQLATTLHPGRTVMIGPEGRSSPLEGAPDWTRLVLHLPREPRARAVPIAIPQEPSPAQQATLDLLVQGRLKLPEE